MDKQILIDLINTEIENKNIVLKNAMSDEDKEVVQNQINNLQQMLDKVSQLEGDNTSEIVEELRNTVTEMGEKLTALNEKINLNKEEEKEEEQMNYLETKNAVHDFAEAIRNSRNGEEFLANWREALKLANSEPQYETIAVEEGHEEAYLPAPVKGMINDIWDRNADWLKDLNDTGAKRFYCRYNTSEQDRETSRAKGHKKGVDKVKQELTFTSEMLSAMPIYKLAEISYQTQFESDEALISYIIGELVDQVLYEIKRAILVGDGRRDDDDYKISTFEALAKDTTDSWTTVSTVASDFLVDDMRAMVDSIKNDNNKSVYVFMSKADLRTLARVQASTTSTPVYMSTEQVAEQIGATRIITTDLLGSDYKAVAFIPSEYYLVGANILNPLFYSWHEGYKNLDVYRYECFAGGGINALKSTAVLMVEQH